MSSDTHRTSPNLWQYLAYCYGHRLPDSMSEWVRTRSLAGKAPRPAW